MPDSPDLAAGRAWLNRHYYRPTMERDGRWYWRDSRDPLVYGREGVPSALYGRLDPHGYSTFTAAMNDASLAVVEAIEAGELWG